MVTNFMLTNDKEKFKWIKEHLYVAIVCDVLDILGYRNQAMHQRLRPLDSLGRGRVMAYDVPIRCGDVVVKPGELIFSDFDGVVAVPKEVEDKVLDMAYEKVFKENQSRRELLNGDSLRVVYDRYGVL